MTTSYRKGYGVNYWDAFRRYILDGGDLSWQTGMDGLRNAGIPFIRMAASPFWPSEYTGTAGYLNNPVTYWSRLDDVMDYAASRNIGVIASLFWLRNAVPDISGENVSLWGDSSSLTRRFARLYAQEFATRYRNHAALWGYEFGNEYNEYATLPNRQTTTRTATVTSVDTVGNTLTSTGHALQNNVGCYAMSTGALPAPLSASTQYFITNVSGATFQLSLTSGGGAIDLTTAGSGTIRVSQSSVANAPVNPPSGTPSFRTPGPLLPNDDLTIQQISAAYQDFAQTIRAIDSDQLKIIACGNNRWRDNSWNCLKSETTTVDSIQQARTLSVELAHGNFIDEHYYIAPTANVNYEGGGTWQNWYSDWAATTCEAWMQSKSAFAKGSGKGVFIGEWQGTNADMATERVLFRRMLNSMLSVKVDVAAMWVYDFAPQEGTFNVTPSNSRAWKLDELAWANRIARGLTQNKKSARVII